jgi:hypothetical protein
MWVRHFQGLEWSSNNPREGESVLAIWQTILDGSQLLGLVGFELPDLSLRLEPDRSISIS